MADVSIRPHASRRRRPELQPRLEHLVSEERLMAVQDSFAKLAGVAAGIMDIDGNWVGRPARHCDYCVLIRKGEGGCELCLKSDRRYVKRAARERRPVIYRCDAGLIDFIVPVIVAGRPSAYIMGGQVLPRRMSKAKLDEVVQLEHRLNLPAGELVDAAKKVRICSKSEILELAGRLQDAAEELASLAWDKFRLDVVHGYAMDLAAANDEQGAFDCTLSCLQQMVAFHTASICMRDEDRILRPKACLGIDKELRRIASFRDGEGLIGTVAKEKQSRIAKDFLTEQIEMPPFKDLGVNKHLRSALTVPMLLDNECVGTIQACSRRADAFEQRDQYAVELVARHLATSLARIQTLRAKEERIAELNDEAELVRGLQGRLAASLELEQDLRIILEKATETTGCTSADVYRLLPGGDKLRFLCAVGVLSGRAPYEVDATRGIAERAIQTGEVQVVSDLLADADYLTLLDHEEQKKSEEFAFLKQLKSALKVPLTVDGPCLGLLCLHSDRQRQFTRRDIRHAKVLADMAAVAIVNAETHGEARRKLAAEIAKLPILDEIPRLLTEEADRGEIEKRLFDLASEWAMKLTGSDWSNVRRLSESEDELKFVSWQGPEWTPDRVHRIYPMAEHSAVASAVLKKKPVVIPDNFEQGAPWIPLFPDARSHVSVPLLLGERVFGALSVDSKKRAAFHEEMVEVLRLVGTQVSLALRSLELIEEAKLLELEKLLGREDNEHVVCEEAIRIITRLVGAQGGSIFLLDQAENVFALAGTTGLRRQQGERPIYYPGEGLTGWICRTGRPLRLENCEDENELRRTANDLHWRKKSRESVDYPRSGTSFLGVPLLLQKQVIGCLRVCIKNGRRTFTEGDERLLRRIANTLAMHLANRRLLRSLNQRVQELAAFREMDIAFAKALTIRDVAGVILQKGIPLAGGNSGHVRVWNEREACLELVEHTPGKMTERAKQRRPGEGISGWVFEQRKKHFAPDIAKDPVWLSALQHDLGQPPEVLLRQFKSGVCLPLIFKDEVIGTLNVRRSDEEGFMSEQLAILDDVSYRAALAIKTAVLLERTQQDLSQRIQRLELLSKMDRAVNSARTPDEIYPLILRHACEVCSAAAGSLRVINHSDGTIRAVCVQGYPEVKELAPVNAGFFLDVVEQQKILVLRDAQQHEAFQDMLRQPLPEAYRDFLGEIRSAVFLPLSVGGRPFGLISIYDREVGHFKGVNGRDLEDLVLHSATAINNAVLFQELEQRLSLREPLALLGEFTYPFVHEMKNTLCAISSIMAADLSGSPSASDVLAEKRKRVGVVTKRASDIVKRLCSFARPGRENWEAIFIDSLVGRVVENMRGAMGNRIACQESLAAPDVQVRGQAAQIESVVLNLVKNAIEAIPSRGTLTVATRPLPAERSVEILVADTGTGILKDSRSRIFSPFFSTKGEDGLGLGLAVVYGLVKAHGGTIEVTDNVGGGTVFRIKLPVKGGRP